MPMLLLAEAGRSLNSDLISLFQHNDDTPKVLERLVQEIHSDKELCSLMFLNHPGSEDMLWGVMNLLGSQDARIAGNAAYVIGTLAEMEMGKKRVVQICTENSGQAARILPTLNEMLGLDDLETVMNAAGTMGTLAEDEECRMWMLREDCLGEAIMKLTGLLLCKDLCTASNAALVLARLTISEEGCARILNSKNSSHILINLCKALGLDDTGRGMNAAFAIGRLCDLEAGCARMMSLQESNRMVTTLIEMLCSNDVGCSKNSCFALSCIASTPQGHARLLAHPEIDEVVKVLSSLLSSKDEESAWFAAMMLHTLASHKSGVLYLREQPTVNPSLLAVNKKQELKDDMRDEVEETIAILKKLDKPKPPSLRVESSYTIIASWEAIQPKSGLDVTYELFMDQQLVYEGPKSSFTAGDLKPVSTHTFCIRAKTEGDEGSYSRVVSASTPESVPSAPQRLRVLAKTTNQIKIGWDTPETANGVLRGYQVVAKGKTTFLEVHENYFIASGLPADTEFIFQVFALTSKGRGDAAVLTTRTEDLGSHSPAKPVLQALGRHEILVSWEPPARPLGRINNYEVKVNGQIIYTGVDRCITAKFLKPNTEYVVTTASCSSHRRSSTTCSEGRNSRVSTKTRKKAPPKSIGTINLPVPSRKPLYPYDKIKRLKQERERVPTANRAKTADIVNPSSAEGRASSSPKTRRKKSLSIPDARGRPHTTTGVVEQSDQLFEGAARKITAGRRMSKSKQSPLSSPLGSAEESIESVPMKEMFLDVPDFTTNAEFCLNSATDKPKERRRISKRSAQQTHSPTAKDRADFVRKTPNSSRRLSHPLGRVTLPTERAPLVVRLPPAEGSSPLTSQLISIKRAMEMMQMRPFVQPVRFADEKQASSGKRTQFSASFDELKHVHRVQHAQFLPSTKNQERSTRTGAESSLRSGGLLSTPNRLKRDKSPSNSLR